MPVEAINDCHEWTYLVQIVQVCMHIYMPPCMCTAIIISQCRVIIKPNFIEHIDPQIYPSVKQYTERIITFA